MVGTEVGGIQASTRIVLLISGCGCVLHKYATSSVFFRFFYVIFSADTIALVDLPQMGTAVYLIAALAISLCDELTLCSFLSEIDEKSTPASPKGAGRAGERIHHTLYSMYFHGVGV